MLRIVGWIVVLVLAVGVVGAGAVYGADTWRAQNAHPGDCGALLEAPRGDLRTDDRLLARAWTALADPDADALGELSGSPPALTRSCLLFAGRTGDAATVVYAEATVAGDLSLLRIAEVRVPSDPGATVQRAVAAHPTLIGSELRAGVLLPLTGDYLAPGRPGEVTAVTAFTSADGYATGTPAAALGEGLFDLGITADRTLAPAAQLPERDAVLLLERSGGTQPERTAVALPAGPAAEPGGPARAAYLLTVDGSSAVDEAALRRVAPVVSVMSGDLRYPLIRDRAIRPPTLDVLTGPYALTLVAVDPAATLLPSFLLTTATPPPTGLLPTR